MHKSFKIKLLTIVFVVGILACKKNTQFEKLNSAKTNITFTNNLPNEPGFNILYYLYYYEGGGVATGDINNDGLADIYFTANTKANNKLYLNKGNMVFEDISEKAKVQGVSDWCSGVTMVDINADGWLDIYVCAVSEKFGLKGHNQLFINKKDGTFEDESAAYGLDLACYSAQSVFFDYDQDGDLDCYLLNESDRPNQNLVDTTFRNKYDAHAGDRLLNNNQAQLKAGEKPHFTDVSKQAGIYQSNLGYGLGLAVADLNNDGWEDIYIGNDFHENDYYYVNNGNGTFTESGAKHFNHYSRFSMGNDIADYNNDGQLDIITVDMLPQEEKILKTYGSDESPDVYKYKITNKGFQYQNSKNSLQRNNGSGISFSETALQCGVGATDWSWCPLFADFDNDGNKDLFITSGIVKRTTDLDYVKFISNAYMQKGLNNSASLDNEAISKMPDGISHNYLYRGNGNLSFDDNSEYAGFESEKGYFNGAAYADLDNDGDLDLVVNAINSPSAIYKNNSAPKNYISVELKGENLNKNSIGAKVYLFNQNKIQYQQLMFTRGFQSASASRLHFGLDTLKKVDSILVVWPNGKMQTLKNVKSNQRFTIDQKNASGAFSYIQYFAPKKDYFVEDNLIQIDAWKHTEDSFNDFNIQNLIPHKQSTRGPKIAVADINNDGLDDYFVCGAKGQPGQLRIQQKNGNFISINKPLFEFDKICEDVDAIFFDANKDGFMDLLVVSGGNEYSGKAMGLMDRLYLNDGKGGVKRSAAFPQTFENKSCVTAADVDNDGDSDVFIGTLADPTAFGFPQTSYLLINDGKGNFSKAITSKIDLNKIGIVTTASFSDINKDGWQDLVVAGEWMPLTIFINEKGKFIKNTIPNSTGLWQTVFVDDVNNDGYLDILAGNWGWNNKFYSNKTGKLNLYVGDFDKNGKVEQLMAYFLNEKEYPFLAKDAVEQPLPLLKKHYMNYSEYAGVEMKDVFYGWIDNTKPLTVNQLGSAVCYGDGKGNFDMKNLPAELQISPIFTFQKMQNNQGSSKKYLFGGNFFGVLPYEGRYDAQALGLFEMTKNKEIKFLQHANFSKLNCEIRDLKWLKINKNNAVLTIGQNNGKLLFYRQP